MKPEELIEYHQHCWHKSDEQHKAMHHKDEVCCRCGKYQCISIIESNQKHGEFWPVLHPIGEVRN